MYLHQKLKYHYEHINDEVRLGEILIKMKNDKPNYIGFDTETTGLNIITDKPFLVSFGYVGTVYTFDYNPEWFKAFISTIQLHNAPGVLR